MSRGAVLPARAAIVHPRGAAPRMRSRLLVLLALAAIAVAAVLLASREPEARHERSAEPAKLPVPVEDAPAATPAEPEGAMLRVSVRDEQGLPLSGARCDVDAWKASAETDSMGLARIVAPRGAPAECAVRASIEGYRPAARRIRLGKERTFELKLLKAPAVRVLGPGAEPVRGVAWGPPGADLRERRVSAPGYLDLDLRNVPREMLAAWDDLLARTPVDVFLVPDAGLSRAVLRVEAPGASAASLGIDLSLARLPDLGTRLGSVPYEWRNFYRARWPEDRISPRSLGAVRSGEEIRVYAEGTVIVTCLAPDCRPLKQEIDVAPGTAVERTLVLERETWADQAVTVTDRFGREGPVSFALAEPVRLPLASQGSTLRVPRGDGPWRVEADGGPRGRAALTVATLPSKEPIRFEFAGITVHLKLVDDESGDPIEGLALHLEGQEGAVTWNPDERAYVFGPVEAGTVAVVHDAERRAEVRVDPDAAAKGILRRELRVRGFPKPMEEDR